MNIGTQTHRLQVSIALEFGNRNALLPEVICNANETTACCRFYNLQHSIPK